MQVVLLTAALISFPTGQATSVYLAGLCRGGTCPDPRFPILDYDKATSTCICKAHPCWNDNGREHRCSEGDFPFLHFMFSANGTLKCSCHKKPQYESIHISRDVCAGQTCDSLEAPILDWDPEGKKCICRPHPCWDVHGVRHECNDPKYPLLHYREEVKADGTALPKCECQAKMEPPPTSLRGSTPQLLESGACTWSRRVD